MHKLIVFLLIINKSVFSQNIEKTDLQLLYDDIDEICKLPERELFCKTAFYYRNKKYDSCYVSSSKLLLNNLSSKERDIVNYFQGTSAINKKMYKKALNNINNISENSNLKNLKNIKLGEVYLRLKDYEKAIISYTQWENNSKIEETDFKMLKKVYHNLGASYVHIKKFVKARKYFDKEIELIDKKDTLSIIKAKNDLANVYYNQYLDDEAIALFKEAYSLAKAFSSIEMKEATADNMAIVEKNRKNFKESIKYYLEHDALRDSIYNRDRIWELTEKDKQIAIGQKQQEIALQDEKLKRQKTQRDSLIFGILGLLLIVIGLGFFYKKLQNQNKIITNQKAALNTANKTKDYLFSVVSHDLRSPMNTIKQQHKELKEHISNNNMQAVKEINKKAIVVTESTSHLLNNVLHWSLEQSNQVLFAAKEIALRPIIEHVLFDYKELVQANDVVIDSELKNAIIKVDKESLKIVLRNVLDNAVKYGGKEILVTTGIFKEDKAFIKIKDNGVGIPTKKLQKINSLTNLSIDKIDRSEGIGLGVVLCHTLVKKNNGKLTFTSEASNGTTVTIELPNLEV